MSDDGLESLLGRLERTNELELRVLGGRHVLAARTSDDDHSFIEFKCELRSRFWRSKGIRIGNQKHRPRLSTNDARDVWETGWLLSDCCTMVQLRRTSDFWRADIADRKEPCAGFITYFEPVLSNDGFVNDKWPTVFIWLFLEPTEFDFVRGMLVSGEKPDFSICATVEFPPSEASDEVGEDCLRWDGAGTLPVGTGGLVWRNHDWSSSFDSRLAEAESTDEPHSEQAPDRASDMSHLSERMNRIEQATKDLAIPLWVIVFAIAVAVWRTVGWGA